MSEMIELILDDAFTKMDGAVSHTRRDMATIRTGRASSAFIEKLVVSAYGVDMTLQELATFSVPEARQLIINPHDAGNVEAIEKAIRNSDIGLSPSNDGRTLRLSFPPLTEERRRDLVKVVSTMAEDGKGRIRGVRRAARKDLEDLEKEGGVSSDDIERAGKELDDQTRAHENEIESARENKEKELLEV
ncbi:MAG: ribosome recycling factor [Acidimicrobiales bacterium]